MPMILPTEVGRLDFPYLEWYDGPVGVGHVRLRICKNETDGLISFYERHNTNEERHILTLGPKEFQQLHVLMGEILDQEWFDPTRDSMFGCTQEDIDEHLAWLEEEEAENGRSAKTNKIIPS